MASVLGTPTTLSFFSPELDLDSYSSVNSAGVAWKPSSTDEIKWKGTCMYFSSSNLTVEFEDLRSYYMEVLSRRFSLSESDIDLEPTFGLKCTAVKSPNGFSNEEYWQTIVYRSHTMTLHNSEGFLRKWEKKGKVRARLNFAPRIVKIESGSKEWWLTAQKVQVRAVYLQDLKKTKVGTICFDKPYVDSEGREGSQSTTGSATTYTCGEVTRYQVDV